MQTPAAATPSPQPDPRLATELAAQRGYLLRFARTKLRDDHAAEDAVQDTLLAALQAQGRFEQRSALRTWLTGILLNKIADVVRRGRLAAGSGSVEEDLAPDDDADSAPVEAADWRCPERALAARQAARALAGGLRQLDPLAQHLFLLRGVEGLSNREAAQRLGLSPERGALLLHRTRARLRHGVEQARLL